jgi:hypothetical protein
VKSGNWDIDRGIVAIDPVNIAEIFLIVAAVIFGLSKRCDDIPPFELVAQRAIATNAHVHRHSLRLTPGQFKAEAAKSAAISSEVSRSAIDAERSDRF